MPVKADTRVLILLFDSGCAQKMQKTASDFVSVSHSGQEFSIFHYNQETLLVLNPTFIIILSKDNNILKKDVKENNLSDKPHFPPLPPIL